MAKKPNLTAKQTDAKYDFEAKVGEATQLPQLDGITFRWINLGLRARTGMRIWTPVTKGTDVGDQVVEYLEKQPVTQIRFTDAHIVNGDLVLAYAPTDVVQAFRSHLAKKADDQISNVVKEHGSKRRIRRMSVAKLTDD